MHSGDNTTNFALPLALGGPFSLVFSLISEIFLDSIFPFWYFPKMDSTIIKVDRGSSSFRIVIPRKLVREMEWERVGYIVVRKCAEQALEIRSLKYDTGEEG